MEMEQLRNENSKLQFMLQEAKDQTRHQDELAKAENALLESKIADLEAMKQEAEINQKEQLDEVTGNFEAERADLEAKIEELEAELEKVEEEHKKQIERI